MRTKARCESNPRLRERAHRRAHLGEVAAEGELLAARNVDVGAVPEADGPEAVPLRLVLPSIPAGEAVDGLRLHGREGRLEREIHGHGAACAAAGSFMLGMLT